MEANHNISPYAVSGKERRELKKELNKLKSYVKNFWHYEDIDRVYGGGMDDKTCNRILDDIKNRIHDIEWKLSLSSISEERNDKLENLFKTN